jgi:hypothetical protein
MPVSLASQRIAMGWWKIENTPEVIGDGPLDALTASAQEVCEQYMTAFGRLPTKSEWECLLSAVLGGEEPESRFYSDPGAAKRVVIENG